MADPRTEGIPRRNGAGALRSDLSPDVPDHRDYCLTDPRVLAAFGRLPKPRPASDRLDYFDAREFTCDAPRPVHISSSVEAVASLIEHFERRASGRNLDLSRGFLNHAAERCAAATNSVVSLRTVLKAARRCGVPSERYYPTTFGSPAPDALAQCFAHDFASLRYLRLDCPITPAQEVLLRVKAFLIAGFPIAFGFTLSDAPNRDQHIWAPTATDDALGSTASIAIGFDDHLRIRSDKGALLVQGIWHSDQQQPAERWLPYSFVRRRLAFDFWTLFRRAWLRSGEFSAPQFSP